MSYDGRSIGALCSDIRTQWCTLLFGHCKRKATAETNYYFWFSLLYQCDVSSCEKQCLSDALWV